MWNVPDFRSVRHILCCVRVHVSKEIVGGAFSAVGHFNFFTYNEISSAKGGYRGEVPICFPPALASDVICLANQIYPQ